MLAGSNRGRPQKEGFGSKLGVINNSSSLPLSHSSFIFVFSSSLVLFYNLAFSPGIEKSNPANIPDRSIILLQRFRPTKSAASSWICWAFCQKSTTFPRLHPSSLAMSPWLWSSMALTTLFNSSNWRRQFNHSIAHCPIPPLLQIVPSARHLLPHFESLSAGFDRNRLLPDHLWLLDGPLLSGEWVSEWDCGTLSSPQFIQLISPIQTLFSTTLSSRIASFSASPTAFVFVRWMTGMVSSIYFPFLVHSIHVCISVLQVYVFYSASFVVLLREVLRPGVLFFLRNLNDPDFNPIQVQTCE